MTFSRTSKGGLAGGRSGSKAEDCQWLRQIGEQRSFKPRSRLPTKPTATCLASERGLDGELQTTKNRSFDRGRPQYSDSRLPDAREAHVATLDCVPVPKPRSVKQRRTHLSRKDDGHPVLS